MAEEKENFVSEEVDEAVALSGDSSNEKARWYVIHTYSGYENKVKANIEKIVENRNMYDVIQEVVIPVEEDIELTKTGKEKKIQRKVFPTYVFVKMIMNDDTWYVVRNTRGVTSFVGPGSKPVPLTDDEVVSMGVESYEDNCGIAVGDSVTITAGPFLNNSGIVKEVNVGKKTIVVTVDFFGRETPVELNFNQVQQMA